MKAIIAVLSILFTSHIVANTCAVEVKALKDQVGNEIRRILLEARSADQSIHETSGRVMSLENKMRRKITKINDDYATGWFANCNNKIKAYSAKLLKLAPMSGDASESTGFVADHKVRTHETFSRNTSPKEIETQRGTILNEIGKGMDR